VTAVEPLRVAARIVGGPAALAVGMAREGRPTEAFAGLLVAGVLLLTALLGWAIALERVMTSDGGSRSNASSVMRPLRPRLVSWLPSGRFGAVAAKELRLLWRDPRQRVQLFGALFGAVLPMFSFRVLTSSSPRIVLVAALPAFVLGAQASNQFGFDGPAHWVSVATADDPRAELLGKNVARALIALPFFVGVLALLAARAGDPDFVLPAAGLAFAAYGTAVGVGNWFSVSSPVPVPESRTNVFSSGNAGQGLAAAGPSLATLFGSAAFLSPLVAAMLVVDARSSLQLLGLVGVTIGAGVWVLTTTAAIRRWRPRQPELLARLSERS
jgi:ABC-2 type transport system permease protein